LSNDFSDHLKKTKYLPFSAFIISIPYCRQREDQGLSAIVPGKFAAVHCADMYNFDALRFAP